VSSGHVTGDPTPQARDAKWTATSETESKSRDLSICVHHYTLRAPCPEGQGKETYLGNSGTSHERVRDSWEYGASPKNDRIWETLTASHSSSQLLTTQNLKLLWSPLPPTEPSRQRC